VATTGCWIDVPLAWQKSDPDALAALYVRDCTVGIEGTNIKAGIIKCARARQLSYPSCANAPRQALTAAGRDSVLCAQTRRASPGRKATASQRQGR